MRELHGNLRFLVKLTKSQIEKGLLAFPRKFQRLFPSVPGKVTVFLDDDQIPRQKPYAPFESTTRECRIYNLRSWFLKHKAAVGDWVEVVVEATGYRLLFRRRSEEEAKYRQQLQSAKTEKQAEDALNRLAQARQRSQNLLVLCPNCHAQMEHADISIKRNEQGWVVTVIINGEERPVHQAFVPTSLYSLPFVLLPFLFLLTPSIVTKIS